MLLRGQVPEYRLAFDPEIKKTARRNRGKNCSRIKQIIHS